MVGAEYVAVTTVPISLDSLQLIENKKNTFVSFEKDQKF